MRRELRPHEAAAGEVFEPVAGYPRYLVSNLGRIYSTIRSGRFLRQTVSPQGYRYVSLMGDDGKPVKHLVHRLVAEAFVPRAPGFDVVNHADGDKQNNKHDNLEWCTYADNNEHAKQNGLNRAFGDAHYNARLSVDAVREIKRRVATGESHKEIAIDFGIARQTVTKIAGGKAWGRAT